MFFIIYDFLISSRLNKKYLENLQITWILKCCIFHYILKKLSLHPHLYLALQVLRTRFFPLKSIMHANGTRWMITFSLVQRPSNSRRNCTFGIVRERVHNLAYIIDHFTSLAIDGLVWMSVRMAIYSGLFKVLFSWFWMRRKEIITDQKRRKHFWILYKLINFQLYKYR